MLHRFSGTGIILDQHDIEAASPILNSMLSQILRRQPDNFARLRASTASMAPPYAPVRRLFTSTNTNTP